MNTMGRERRTKCPQCRDGYPVITVNGEKFHEAFEIVWPCTDTEIKECDCGECEACIERLRLWRLEMEAKWEKLAAERIGLLFGFSDGDGGER